MTDDYYAVLELTKTATEGDIRKAYRRMALRWHPDKNQDNKEEAHQKFKEISEAYEVLSDPNKRRIYDVYGKAGLETESGGSSGGSRGHSRHQAGFHDFHHDFHSFVFRDPQEVFREFFGNRDPFADFMFIDPFAAFGRQHQYYQQQQQHAGNLFQSNFIGFPTMQMHDPFFSFGHFGGLGAHAALGGNGAQFMSFSSSGMGPNTQFRSSSTSTRIVNGRQIVTKKVVENGVETVTVTENGRVVSKTVNGQAQSIEGPSAASSSSSAYASGHHGYSARAGSSGGAAAAPRIASAQSLSSRPGSSGSSGGGGGSKRYGHQQSAEQLKRQRRREDHK